MDFFTGSGVARYLCCCVLFRSFNGGVIYSAILPSSGWTNILAHSTKAKIDPADTSKS